MKIYVVFNNDCPICFRLTRKAAHRVADKLKTVLPIPLYGGPGNIGLRCYYHLHDVPLNPKDYIERLKRQQMVREA